MVQSYYHVSQEPTWLVLCKEMDELISYPVHCTEVDSFSKVETLVESAVVSSGKSDDKFTCTLVGAIDLVKRKKGQKNYKLYISNYIL